MKFKKNLFFLITIFSTKSQIIFAAAQVVNQPEVVTKSSGIRRKMSKSSAVTQGLPGSVQSAFSQTISQPIKITENNSSATSSVAIALTNQEVDLINFFCRPIDFTPDGINYYFKYVYNHPEYVHYIPYSLSHMIQFLDYGAKSGQNEQFAASVIKMFLQKIKAAPFVQAEAFAEFVPKFTQAMKPYLQKKEANFLKEMQVVIKDKLTQIFAKYFSYFQSNPTEFMDSLAEQIAKQTNQSVTQQHIEVEQLKKDVVRFLEIAANKLVWATQEEIQVWNVCNRLADECKFCLDQNVLSNKDALDDLCWSLIHRFCYFVELSYESLPKNFYQQVLCDLQSKPCILFSLEEQEDLMTSKKSHLLSRMQLYQELCKSV